MGAISGAATGTIGSYTAATGIDPAADYLLIEQIVGPIYKAINRNTLLGITGSPVGTSDTQALTNKTIGNTNAITVKDGSLTLQNTSDATKQAKFSLASVTTGTTRTYALPNASVTLASLTGTETLTNKTLTAPAISGGTIDNAAITVDSISGHTSAAIVTVGGVQMNNGTIATSGAVVTASIAAGAVVPNSLVASSGAGWAWQTYSPTTLNFAVGNGSVVARYAQVGKLVVARVTLNMGSTSAMGTDPLITLPVPAKSGYTAGGESYGSCQILHSGNYITPGVLVAESTTTVRAYALTISSALPVFNQITASVPFTWGTSDALYFYLCYEAA